MHKKIWGAAQVFGAAVFTVIAALVSVTPEEATSRLAKWLQFFGMDQIPAILSAPYVDIWIRTIAILAALILLIFWGHRKWFGGKRMLPLIAFIISGCAFALCGVWLWTSLHPQKHSVNGGIPPVAAPGPLKPDHIQGVPANGIATPQVPTPEPSPAKPGKRRLGSHPSAPGSQSTIPAPIDPRGKGGDTYNVENSGPGMAIGRVDSLNITAEDKSLKRQFRNLLSVVDGRIPLMLDGGTLSIRTRMTTDQFNRFQQLCNSSGSATLVSKADVVGKVMDSQISNGLGPTTAEHEQFVVEITFTNNIRE